MPFESVKYVINCLDSKEIWKQQKKFQRILDHWTEVVGPVIRGQTQPLYVHNGVLRVATSSPVWAQTLMFERQRILEKLNPRLTVALTDIRFSTAQWGQPASPPQDLVDQAVWQDHPSYIPPGLVSRGSPPQASPPQVSEDPRIIFNQWAEGIRSRAQNLPLCPDCRCPTPPGELQRWARCSLCHIKHRES